MAVVIVRNILVVEDDHTVARALQLRLETAGYKVVTENLGEAALKFASEHPLDLVVLDLKLPDISGLEVCSRLRKLHGPWLPVLILTGMDEEARLVEAFEAGVDDFVVKPFSPKALQARLRAGQRVIGLQQEVESDREEIRHFAAELAMTNRRLQQAALEIGRAHV